MVLEDISDGIFSLGLEMGDREDEGLEVREELPDDILEIGLGRSPELCRCSEGGLVLGDEAEVGLGVDVADGLGGPDDPVIPGLDTGLLVLGLTVRWLLYELRMGSLYRSTVRTFP